MIFPIVIEKTTYISYESSMTNRLIIEMFHSCVRPLPLPPAFDRKSLAFASKNARRKKRRKKESKRSSSNVYKILIFPSSKYYTTLLDNSILSKNFIRFVQLGSSTLLSIDERTLKKKNDSNYFNECFLPIIPIKREKKRARWIKKKFQF